MHLTINVSKEIGTFAGRTYRLIEGTFAGEIGRDESIPGLANAKNGHYTTTFQLLTPVDPQTSNGTLLLDLPNRSVPCSSYVYNSPLGHPLAVGTHDIGNGFLQRQGFIIASVQWEVGQGFQPPVFIDADTTRFVEGAALAVIRDFLFYLRTDPAVLPTLTGPISAAVRNGIGVGWSQTGRLLKTLIRLGFHVKQGQVLLDALHHHAGPVGWLPIFNTGSGPGSSATYVPSADNPDVRGIIEEPLSPNSLLTELRASGYPVPKFIFTVTSLDYYILRASLFRTGGEGTEEEPFDESVRVYDIAGGVHALIPAPGCAGERGRLDWRPIMRAVLLQLQVWVDQNQRPPDSVLMPLSRPTGDLFHLKTPAYLPNATVLLPTLDADNNPVGGIRLPDLAVPLGTHGLPNSPVTDFSCFISGSYIPFSRTKEERIRLGDQRLSVVERYAGVSDYLEAYEAAVQTLIEQRFILPDEGATLMDIAASAFAASMADPAESVQK